MRIFQLIEHKLLFTPTSETAEPLWVSGENKRTTFDLLSTCILTLIVCIWTAVHLNIPPRHERKRGTVGMLKRGWGRVKWMIIGLLAPEIVLFIAFNQFLEARFRGLLRRVFQRYTDDYIVRPFRWCIPKGIERGFYVVMGGYEYYGEIDGDARTLKRIPQRKRSRSGAAYGYYQITPAGAICLAHLGRFPVVDIDDINDKSKADSLSKTLVCMQASWMIIQCIARKVSGLPITLLEINTVMHVVCALIMYILWLKKPQNVRSPTLITRRSNEVAARFLQQRIINWDPHRFFIHEPRPLVIGHILTPKLTASTFRPARAVAVDAEPVWPRYYFPLHSKLAREEGEPYALLSTKGASNLKIHGRITGRVGLDGSMFFVGAAVAAIYGGAHLAPWHGHFPTYFERYLWRASGCIVAATGIPLGLYKFHSYLRATSDSHMDSLLPWEWDWDMDRFEYHVLSIALLLLLGLYTLVYPFARIYLVAEAFSSLRSLPVGAYKTADWIEMWPHL
ncbi:hypothetical protein DFH27DRAFT_483737 [Peziza echinospora]|nr:hypothetical protein DFH27DRAFT_483737 [Peziza echinospora]